MVTGYPQVLIHYVGPLPVVVCALPDATSAEIAADLAPHSPEKCAARGIRHSSEDDHSTAIATGDTERIRRMMLTHSVAKVFRGADKEF